MLTRNKFTNNALFELGKFTLNPETLMTFFIYGCFHCRNPR